MGSIERPVSEPREFTPNLYPTFPTSAQPCADLQTISLAAIKAGDESEQARLLAICKDQGFFYLDVSNSTAQYLAQDAENIGHLSEDLFKLPVQEKMKYPWGRKPYSLLGYKPTGFVKADQHGSKKDTSEFWNCGKDDLLEIPGRFPTDLPPLLQTSTNRSLLSRFQTEAHRAGLDILSALAIQLGLPANVFDDQHRLDRPADTHARLIRGPARVSCDDLEIQTPGHTDFGSITLLFNWLGGLQIWSQSNHGESFDNSIGSEMGPETGRSGGQWLWVRPKPGYAIVNLGDLVVKQTGGVLCAARHRVLPAPGEQGHFPRYSLGYLIRPADDHISRRLEGGVVPPLKDGEVEELLTTNQWAAKQVQQLKDGKTKTEA